MKQNGDYKPALGDASSENTLGDRTLDSAMQTDRYTPHTIGVLGGGQLGRMLLAPAARLGVNLHVLDPDPSCPCAAFCGHTTQGSFRDYDTVVAFGRGKDTITIEIEDVNVDALDTLMAEGVRVAPSPGVIREIQDKGLQKQLFDRLGLPTAPWWLAESSNDIQQRLSGQNGHAFPGAQGFVQKLRRGGYDGKGVKVVQGDAADAALLEGASVVESLVDIDKELAIIVARNARGDVRCFPVVEMVFDPELNLVDFLFAPARITADDIARAEHHAQTLAEALGLEGILAVELFLTRSGELLVNEMAPRPHNSGHHTIEANHVSQYEQHLRAILNLPLGGTRQDKSAAMLNLIGAPGHTGSPVYQGLQKAMQMPGVYPHIYGKSETRPGRKMGHITVVGNSPETVIAECHTLKNNCQVIT